MVKKMRYVRIGEHQPDALNKLHELQPLDGFNRSPLNRIDTLLMMIKEEHPDNLPDYISNLILNYEHLLNTKIIEKYPLPGKLLEDKKMMKNYPRLAGYILNYYLHLLHISNTSDWTTDKIKTTQRNFFRSFLLPKYYNLQILIETIGRKKAINLYKKYVSQFFIQLGKPDNHNFVNLKQHYEKVIKPVSPPSDWISIRGMMDNGKYFYMNENCLWIEALTDLDDSELKYLVCCYGDYQSAQHHYNQHIILTMEHTIAQGDPYCSRVLHDTREDWDLRHPQKEFWDNLHNQS
jgi:hypothetical protein